jgi:phosphotransferase system IIB component
MDIAQEFGSLGLSAEVITLFSDEKNSAALAKIIEASKAPLVTKRDELLGQITNHKTFLTSLGGEDAIKSLAQAKAEADQKVKDALAQSTDANAVRDTLGKEIKTRDEKIQALLGEKKDAKVRSQVKRALTEAKGDADLLMPHITSRLKSEVNDAGEVVITVLNEDGKPWMVGTDAKPAKISDLLESFKKNASLAKGFSASGTSGSGATFNAGALKGVVNPWAPETLNLTKQGEIVRSNPEMAKALKAAVGRV